MIPTVAQAANPNGITLTQNQMNKLLSGIFFIESSPDKSCNQQSPLQTA